MTVWRIIAVLFATVWLVGCGVDGAPVPPVAETERAG